MFQHSLVPWLLGLILTQADLLPSFGFNCILVHPIILVGAHTKLAQAYIINPWCWLPQSRGLSTWPTALLSTLLWFRLLFHLGAYLPWCEAKPPTLMRRSPGEGIESHEHSYGIPCTRHCQSPTHSTSTLTHQFISWWEYKHSEMLFSIHSLFPTLSHNSKLHSLPKAHSIGLWLMF